MVVASFAEAWIENDWSRYTTADVNVASFAEAWIENHYHQSVQTAWVLVASFAEAWIENWVSHSWYLLIPVASFAEAWIEILLVQKSVKLMHGRLLRGGVH